MVKKDVLVTDGRWHKTLAVVRSLGKKNINITCGDSTRLACSLFSRYCKKKLIYPKIKDNPRSFINSILEELEKQNYGVLFPMEEDTMKVIANNIGDFDDKVSIPMVDKNTLMLAMNKEELIKFAQKNGVPCPKTYFIDNINQIKTLKKEIKYPAVIKPRIGSGAKGVKYIANEKELEEEYIKIHNIFSYPLIQERIPQEGEAIGVSAVFDRDRNLIASFSHRRIRQYPVTGGASTLCESYYCPSIEKIAIELLKKLNWYGVAMVEFKVDPRDNTPKLMEINARLWGSLQLAISSGVDFPHLLYKIAMNEKVEKIKDYKIGTKFRWLIPGDILHFIFTPNKLKIMPDFFNFFEKDTTDAILSLEDPFPIIGKLLTGFTFLYDREMRKHLYLKLGINKSL